MLTDKFDRKEIMKGNYGPARAIEIYIHENAEFSKCMAALNAFRELAMVMRGRGWRQAIRFNVLNDKLLTKYIKAIQNAEKKFEGIAKEVEDYQRLLSRRRIQVFKNPNLHHKINIKKDKEASNDD